MDTGPLANAAASAPPWLSFGLAVLIALCGAIGGAVGVGIGYGQIASDVTHLKADVADIKTMVRELYQPRALAKGASHDR